MAVFGSTFHEDFNFNGGEGCDKSEHWWFEELLPLGIGSVCFTSACSAQMTRNLQVPVDVFRRSPQRSVAS